MSNCLTCSNSFMEASNRHPRLIWNHRIAIAKRDSTLTSLPALEIPCPQVELKYGRQRAEQEISQRLTALVRQPARDRKTVEKEPLPKQSFAPPASGSSAALASESFALPGSESFAPPIIESFTPHAADSFAPQGPELFAPPKPPCNPGACMQAAMMYSSLPEHQVERIHSRRSLVKKRSTRVRRLRQMEASYAEQSSASIISDITTGVCAAAIGGFSLPLLIVLFLCGR